MKSHLCLPWSLSFVFALLALTFSTVDANVQTTSPPPPSTDPPVHTSSTSSDFAWKSIVEVSDETFERMTLPASIDWHQEVFTQSSGISPKCQAALAQALENVHQRKTWAAKMFNSWAKFPPSGSWHGTLTDFGDYDQCLSVQRPTQYCLVDIKVPMPSIPQWHNLFLPTDGLLPPMSDNLPNHTRVHLESPEGVYPTLANVSAIFYYISIRTGICVPSDCAASQDVFALGNLNAAKLGMKVSKFTCDANDVPSMFSNLNTAQLCALIFLILAIAYNLFVVIVDKFVIKNCDAWYLSWFNPIENTKKILFAESKDDLTCIHGLRVFTILWIIAGHTLEWNDLSTYRNTFALRERLSELSLQPFFKAHYSVDTFFYMSGLLTSYVTLKMTKGKYSRFNIFAFFSMRYFRLTPQLAVYILLSTLVPGLFNGPLWKRYMLSLNERCNTNWWINMLYMQNIIDVQNICALHTWYIAVDMQLHWLSLIPIIVLLLNRARGIAVTKMIVLAGTVLASVWVFLHQLPPGSVITSRNNFLDEIGRPSDYLYFFYSPWSHVSVFFTGFIFGCFIERFTAKKIQLSKSTRYGIWTLVVAIYLFCCFNTLPWLYGRPYDRVWSAIIFPLNMLLWASMLNMIVWMCLTKNGGWADKILSWPALRPFSRLTYCVYLVHPWAFFIILGTKRDLVDSSMQVIIAIWTSVIVLSYIFGAVYTVLFEAPVFHALAYFKGQGELMAEDEAKNNNLQENSKEMQLLSIETEQQTPSSLNNSKN